MSTATVGPIAVSESFDILAQARTVDSIRETLIDALRAKVLDAGWQITDIEQVTLRVDTSIDPNLRVLTAEATRRPTTP